MIDFGFDIWIYDVEVFKYDWIITFQKYTKEKEVVTIVNDLNKLYEFYQKNIHYKAVLVGYNNKHYDDYILRALLVGADPYNVSLHIIEFKKPGWEYPALQYQKNHLISYDVSNEIGIGTPLSLKQLEGYFGWKIFESSIPFDIDRKLTEIELNKTIEYNKYDVLATWKIFDRFGVKLLSHIALVDEFNIPIHKLNMSGARKTAYALKAKKIDCYETFNYVCPDIIKEHLFFDLDLIQKFEEQEYKTKNRENFSFERELNDFTFHFALGGGHGAINNYQTENTIWNLDVKSYYVSLMIRFNFVSRALGLDGKEKIKELLKLRIENKNKKNLPLADGLKMLLVAIYGSMAYENSLMWDVQMQTSVCITGQLLLYILCKWLEPYCKIIQINTDGIMIQPYDEEKCTYFYKKWEETFSLELEKEVGTAIIQKDVNNYVFVKDKNINWNDKKDIDKKIKAKGMNVKSFNYQMHNDDFYQIANFTASNNHTIIDEAVVKYFLLKKPIAETINQCRDLIRFQFVLKLTKNFDTIVYKKNEEYLEFPEKELRGLKCYRLFAVKNNGYDIYKRKIVDGDISFNKISRGSNSMIVLNDDLKNYDFNDIEIDYNHYIQMAQKIVDDYKYNDFDDNSELF